MTEFIARYNNFTIYDEKKKAYVLSVSKATYQTLPKDDRASKLFDTSADTLQLQNEFQKLENTIETTEDFKEFEKRHQEKPTLLLSLDQQIALLSPIKVLDEEEKLTESELDKVATEEGQSTGGGVSAPKTDVNNRNFSGKKKNFQDSPYKKKKDDRVAPLAQSINDKEPKNYNRRGEDRRRGANNDKQKVPGGNEAS